MAMVTAGADVHAVDNNGISPSDYACYYDHVELWVQVLAACGYNPMEVFDIEYISSRLGVGMLTFFTREVPIRATKLSFEEYYAYKESTGCGGRSSGDEDWNAKDHAEIKAIYGDSEESIGDESSRSDCEECEYSESSDWDDDGTEDNASVCQDDDYESIDGDPAWRAYIPRHQFLWYWVKVEISEDTDSEDSYDEGDYTEDLEDESEADYDGASEDEGEDGGANWNKLD